MKKGQKGIRILAPMIGTKRKKYKEADKDITKQNEPVLVGFRAVYVFDVSQTEGAELPDLKERVKGDVGGCDRRGHHCGCAAGSGRHQFVVPARSQTVSAWRERSYSE